MSIGMLEARYLLILFEDNAHHFYPALSGGLRDPADSVIFKRVRLNGPPEVLRNAAYSRPKSSGSFFLDSCTFPCKNPGIMARVAGIPFSKLSREKQHAIFVAQRKQRATPAENLFCSYLASLGLSYRFQQGFYIPCYRIADFYVPSLNIIIEIDGPCHDPEKDRRRDEWFERVRGIRTLRLTNEQVLMREFATLNDFITNVTAHARRIVSDP
jgi:very-short-patch-repair endonuclease